MAIAQIALADDHPLFAEGIRRLLETEYEIIATALDGRELLQRLQEADPNVVIGDIGMPILNGIVTTQRLKESKPNIKIVVVSQHTDRSFLRAAFSAGADAYVTKQSSPNELREAVRRVLGGEVYVSPALVEARALAGL